MTFGEVPSPALDDYEHERLIFYCCCTNRSNKRLFGKYFGLKRVFASSGEFLGIGCVKTALCYMKNVKTKTNTNKKVRNFHSARLDWSLFQLRLNSYRGSLKICWRVRLRTFKIPPVSRRWWRPARVSKSRRGSSVWESSWTRCLIQRRLSS